MVDKKQEKPQDFKQQIMIQEVANLRIKLEDLYLKRDQLDTEIQEAEKHAGVKPRKRQRRKQENSKDN